MQLDACNKNATTQEIEMNNEEGNASVPNSFSKLQSLETMQKPVYNSKKDAVSKAAQYLGKIHRNCMFGTYLSQEMYDLVRKYSLDNHFLDISFAEFKIYWKPIYVNDQLLLRDILDSIKNHPEWTTYQLQTTLLSKYHIDDIQRVSNNQGLS